MKKTQKIAALACAGMVAAGIAALPISAATNQNSEDVQVKYVAGATPTNPDINQTNLLVALPADVTFADDGGTADLEKNDYSITLLTKDGTNFPASLDVKVEAKSAKALELTATGITATGEYHAKWGENLLNKTTNAPQNGALAVQFEDGFNPAKGAAGAANTAGNVDVTTQNTLVQPGTLTLPRTEVDKLEKTKKGAIFTDTLTFRITDATNP